MNLAEKINRDRRLSFFSLCALFLLLIFFNACSGKAQRNIIAEFTGDDIIFNFSKSLTLISYEHDSVNPTLILTNYGDLLYFGEMPYVYTKSSGTRVNFKSAKYGEYVNGKISTLKLPTVRDMTSWFKIIDTADFSELEFLKIDSLIPENVYPYLKKISEAKNGTGIIYSGAISDISNLFALFNPRYLICETTESQNFGLPSMSNLELLVVAVDDSLSVNSLPSMPKLKQLIITGDNNNTILTERFLKENKSIEKLSIIQFKTIDFSVLKPLTNLKELAIVEYDTILNPELLANHPTIEVLSILADDSKTSLLTAGLTGLKWITFPPGITQENFNSTIGSQPGLETVVIGDNTNITSLEPLLKLRKLSGLCISDTLTDAASVRSLKNLKYLSLPSSVLKEKSSRDEWQKFLPGTRISANEGFCLGSGWLLLIVPLSLFFYFMLRKITDKKNATV